MSSTIAIGYRHVRAVKGRLFRSYASSLTTRSNEYDGGYSLGLALTFTHSHGQFVSLGEAMLVARPRRALREREPELCYLPKSSKPSANFHVTLLWAAWEREH